MSNDKTTEQIMPDHYTGKEEIEIPNQFLSQVYDVAEEFGKSMDGYVGPLKVADFGFRKGAYWAYRHLQSLPPSPVEEADARWVKADLSQNWKDNPSREVIVRIVGMKFKYDVTTPATIIYFLQQGREIYFLQEEQTNNHGK